ncbi:exodeoxyribonuclease V subunit gamma [Methylonatrum kenyense]|uniref:exodeoxyribonuclease V subunit gamma n=1 Tax=Methylonatrum kenyense TaxID=455253 RepID=UPI0020BD75FB|nr:exodeoxyribonuclease V subunit gamma [Methylonatrum kenyense]MCK8514967.1 exodeoxyribonuclease V subunit gamma [Methylonatrum kenyense]
MPDTGHSHHDLQPGLAVLHGNRLESLRTLVVDWLRAHPLAPLESETVLVQSNGMAQWLKLALAAPEGGAEPGCGIAAAQHFLLPQSFLWQAYRAVLGAEAVPETSPFEKQRLQWRIYRLLPGLLAGDPDTFAPLVRFLDTDQDSRKRHQLARRLADLFDQYQVYRADWLADWLEGRDQLTDARGKTRPLAEDLRWQAVLWRALHADAGEAARLLSRPGIQQRFIQALDRAAPGSLPELPRRVLVFGITSLPRPVLDALHALSRHCQILQLVQNPSGHFWADLVEDRELLQLDRHRHQRNFGTPGHPLLAAWGKQGRDFIALLDQIDEPERYRDWFQSIDVFEPPVPEDQPLEDAPLLQQIQQDIFDLTPLPEPGAERALVGDRSIRFHRAHSRQREVEILHDRLLDAFARADAAGQPLRPRDIIVMVPDIDAYAPAVEAVFGTVNTTDPRYIPYTIGDRRARSEAPLAVALEKLADLPNARLTLGDVLDLLEVAAFRRRFGLTEEDLPLLRRWCRDAGIRWGLDGAQRRQLELDSDFEQNSWRFGLRRMLLGYAVGTGEAWQAIEPYPEIGSLDAALLGPLRALLDTLEQQLKAFREPGRPADWAQRIEALLTDCFALHGADELALESRVVGAMQGWTLACEEAGFDEPIPLSVARDAWLSALEDEGPAQRFLAGRVNICTMMPMRSIPFRLVCLLGMNDGDYPRTRPPLDFDLMALKGQYRPGDRSRRDDDRYLFLEALLAAREQLHISWIGRNPRDNEPLPPSVLVNQLRDHLDRGWRVPDRDGRPVATSEALTVDHPLPPFSPRYADDGELFTYAREWEAGDVPATAAAALDTPELPEDLVLTINDLNRFLADPARHFLSERLKLRFDSDNEAPPENEPFEVSGLDAYGIHEALLQPLREDALRTDPETAIRAAGQRLMRSGQLPVAGLGQLQLDNATAQAVSAAERWQALRADYPTAEPPRELRLQRNIQGRTLTIEDWSTDLFQAADGRIARLVLKAGDTVKQKKPHYPRLLRDWVQHLVLNAAGIRATTCIVGHDDVHTLRPLDVNDARERLDAVLDGWLTGLQQPLPLPLRTVFAYLTGKAEEPATVEALENHYEGNSQQTGEVDYDSSGALQRCFPTTASLLEPRHQDQSLFDYWAGRLHRPLVEHLTPEDAE